MNLKELNIVNGEFNIMYYSIRMKLDDVIKDKDTEQVILENLIYMVGVCLLLIV